MDDGVIVELCSTFLKFHVRMSDFTCTALPFLTAYILKRYLMQEIERFIAN